MIREGIININKPAGMTSHDCVSELRRLTGIKRIGHTGTLDPNATGVLPLCIGSCARITEYLDLDMKKYSCTMVLGIETDTLDVWGKVLQDNRSEMAEAQAIQPITEEAVLEIFESFKGMIEQYPPKYSALKVDGKRLYQYARAGQEVEIKPRNTYISYIEVKSFNSENMTVDFEVECSKGTYIRSICRDVGIALGYGAAMSRLVRLASGAFNLKNSVDLEILTELKNRKRQCPEEAEAIDSQVNDLMFSADYPLVHFGKAVIISADRAKWFTDGGHISLSEVNITREPTYEDSMPPMGMRVEYARAYNMYGHKGEEEIFLGVAFYNTQYKKLVADKVFARG